MNYNLNSGYGKLMSEGIIAAQPGKFFLVGKSGLAYRDVYGELFPADQDGKPRAVFATLAQAVASCTANAGDIIYILPGHTETISSSTALTLSVAGITIIGLGTGSVRPTFTLDTATSARINVTAANVTVRNCLFIANFAAIVTCFLNNTGPEFWIDNCEFRDTSSILNFVALVTTTAAVSADGLKFTNNRIAILGVTATTTPIKLLANTDRVQIMNNFVVKAVLNNTSCVLAHGALVMTNLQMAFNKIFSANTDSATGGFLITTSSTTNTGMVHDNYVQALDVAAAILVTAGSVYGMFNNLYDGDADASGFVLPAIGVN